MRLLLTSGGLENQKMINALRELMDKDFEDSKVVFVPTAANGSDLTKKLKGYVKTNAKNNHDPICNKCSDKKVWKFWTQPKYIIKWNYASNDWECPEAENDLRKVGRIKRSLEKARKKK